ncbi:MAG TPA: SIMPL domain-containing protein [Sphingomonas sp.]|nr:SIMPL domain-containing protein [Sphingomonas sp.]
MRILLAAAAASAFIAPAWGATVNEDAATHRIVVVGHGVARATPDAATLTFTLRGEGRQSDDAAQSLVAMQSAAAKALASLGVAPSAIRTGELSIMQVRNKACYGDNDYAPSPRLSVGECAVTGYVASLDATVRMTPDQAGTAGGLMGRIGASDVRVAQFSLNDDRALRNQAIAAALADARAQADAIAKGTGERLGPLLLVRDQNAASSNGQEIVVTAARVLAPAPAHPPVVMPLSPSPIEREANLIVTYAIQP